MKNKIINAGIRITRECNMRCQYCNIQAEKRKTLSLAEWEKALFIIEKLGAKKLVILGGEPTEFEKLPQLVKYIKENLNFECSMTTNGYNNFDELMEIIKAGLDRLGFSVDTLNIKNSISPLKCKCGLALIDKLLPLKPEGLTLVDYAVINKKNIQNIIELTKFMTSKGIHIYFLPFHHGNEGKFDHRKNNESFAFVSDEDIKLYEETIKKIIKLKNEGYLIDNSRKFLEASIKHIRNLDWKCNGLSELRIDSDGQMVCCCDNLGDVNKEFSIFDLTDEKKLQEFYKLRNKDASCCSGCLWPSSFEAELARERSE